MLCNARHVVYYCDGHYIGARKGWNYKKKHNNIQTKYFSLSWQLLYTVLKNPRLLDRIWDLFRWENGTIWNPIHFMIDGRLSISWEDILDTIQLYPKEIWKEAGIQSDRNRYETWKVIQIVPFYKPEWSKSSSRKVTKKNLGKRSRKFRSIWFDFTNFI